MSSPMFIEARRAKRSEVVCFSVVVSRSDVSYVLERVAAMGSFDADELERSAAAAAGGGGGGDMASSSDGREAAAPAPSAVSWCSPAEADEGPTVSAAILANRER